MFDDKCVPEPLSIVLNMVVDPFLSPKSQGTERVQRPDVDASTTPWKVVREKCAGYKLIDNGDGTAHVSPTLTPARKRTLFIKAKAAAAGK